MSSDIPDIRGRWYYFIKVLRQETPGSKPSFDNYRFSQFITEIEQDGQYVIIQTPADPPLRPDPGYYTGVLNKVFTANGEFWQLVLSDYDDNGVYTMTIADSQDGVVTKWAGAYTEPGFVPGIPAQLPTSGLLSLTKITAT